MTFEAAKAFVTAWYEADSLADVCRVTGLDRRGCSNRAAHLRSRGVELPILPVATEAGVRTSIGKADWLRLARWAQACAAARRVREMREGR